MQDISTQGWTCILKCCRNKQIYYKNVLDLKEIIIDYSHLSEMVGAFLYLILGEGKILEIFTKLFKSGDKPKNVTAGSVCNFFFVHIR